MFETMSLTTQSIKENTHHMFGFPETLGFKGVLILGTCLCDATGFGLKVTK